MNPRAEADTASPLARGLLFFARTSEPRPSANQPTSGTPTRPSWIRQGSAVSATLFPSIMSALQTSTSQTLFPVITNTLRLQQQRESCQPPPPLTPELPQRAEPQIPRISTAHPTLVDLTADSDEDEPPRTKRPRARRRPPPRRLQQQKLTPHGLSPGK